MENRTSFGVDAGAYKTFRPTYPDALYLWLAGLCEHHDAALDCATGNGQAACALVRHFERVVATDTDAAQIAAAARHERIDYVVASAEELSPTLGRFDLVTVAQGAHWFDLPLFHQRLEALLNPSAVIAIWGYSHGRVEPRIDALLRECLEQAVDPYWGDGNRIIMERYRSIAFPWKEIVPPSFAITEHWSRAEFFGFVGTWSAHRRLIAAGQPDPLAALAERLDAAGLWPESDRLAVTFDLHMRVGRA